MKVYNMPPWQEKMQEILASGKKLSLYRGRNYGKKTLADYITNDTLAKMKKGQTFGLATLEGLFVFKLTEVKKYKKRGKR